MKVYTFWEKIFIGLALLACVVQDEMAWANTLHAWKFPQGIHTTKMWVYFIYRVGG